MILKGIVDKKYRLTLLQLNEKPLGGIENFYDFSFSPAFADIGELSFNLPKYGNDGNGNKVLNQIYERISEDMLVEVDGEHIFYIDRVSEKSDIDQEYKEIHAYSREYELSHKRLVNYKVEGRFLYYIEPDGNKGFPFNDSTYPGGTVKFPTVDSDGFYLGLFNEIERLTSWKLKRDLVTGHPIIPAGLAKITRGFDISDANLTEVLKNIQEAFGCIFVYDTKNREIKIIEVGELVDSGFMISDKNFIESITKDLQVSKTITRLNVYDKDGKGIGRKMAHGKDYVENYSYYMNDKFMSEELISAIQEYMDINNSYMTATATWWNLYDRATAERLEVELIILKYKEELIPHFVTIDILTTKRDGGTNADGTVIPPGALTSTEIAQLNNARTEHDRINKKIKTLEEGYVYTTPRSLPAIDYDINRAKDELDKQSGKVDMESVFSDYEVAHSLPAGSLMDEMDPFIKIDTHVLDYSTNLEDVYQAGIRALNKVSKPHLQFEIGDLADFLQIAEYEDLSNALQLGTYTVIEHTGLGFYDRVLLLNYTHKPDSNSISLRFSDTLGYFEEYSDIAQLIAKSSSVGSRIDLKSSEWSSGGFGSFENAGYIHQDIRAVNIEVARLEADKIGVSELDAVNATIEYLQGSEADFENLTTITASIASLQAGKADLVDLNTKYAEIGGLLAEKASIENLNARDVTIAELYATKANLNSLAATKANVADLTVTNASIADLQAGKADVADLNAARADIGILQATSGDITHLLTGNLTAENFKANAITATSGVIANGAITNAMITNLDAGKINAGRVNTSLVEVGSESGNLTIVDNTIQISDNNDTARVQIGKDASDDYNMYVWDADGNLMFDATGLHADGIKSEIIRNDMVAPNANISGSKLNIGSVVEEINDGTTRIESANINYDGKSLNVAFGEMESHVDELEDEIELRVKTTDFTIEQGKIATLISDVEIIEGDVDATSSKVSTIEQNIEGMTSTVSELVEDVNATESNISALTQNVGEFKAEVSSTYATNEKVDGIEARVDSAELKITDQAIVSTVTSSTTYKEDIQSRVEDEVEKAPIYTWIMYSQNADGSGLIADSTDAIYVGIASGKVSKTPSTDPSDYEWTKIKGEDGLIGRDGEDGQKGDTGATGKGVTSITEEYAISTSKTTAPDDAEFSTTQPAWTTGSYIWTRNKIVYNNPTSTVYTTPIVSSEWEAVNNLEFGGRNYILQSDVRTDFANPRNLFNMDNAIEVNSSISTSGELNYGGTIYTTIAIKIKEGKTYTISYDNHSGNRFAFGFFEQYESNETSTVGKFNSSTFPTINGLYENYTAPEGANYLIIYCNYEINDQNLIPEGLKVIEEFHTSPENKNIESYGDYSKRNSLLTNNWEVGTITETSSEGSSYEQMKSSSNTRMRLKNLIHINGTLTVFFNSDEYEVSLAYFDENRNYLGEYTGWESQEFTTPNVEYVSILLRYKDNREIDIENDMVDLFIKIIENREGDETIEWSPEDFNNLKGKEYLLSINILEPDQWYTLSIYGLSNGSDTVGAWLGSDNFIGVFDNDTLTFKTIGIINENTIIIKTLLENSSIDRIKLERGTIRSDYSVAQEDASIIQSTLEPVNPIEGTIWLNTSLSPPEFNIYSNGNWSFIGTDLATVNENLGNINSKLVLIDGQFVYYDEQLNTLDEAVKNTNENLATLRTDYETKVEQLDDRIDSTVSKTDSLEEDGKIVRENFTKISQRIDNVTTTIKVNEGSNIIKNSVGYGGLNNWKLLSGSIGYNSTSNWMLDGVAKHGWVISQGSMVQEEIELRFNKNYSFSGRLLKTSGPGIIKITLHDSLTKSVVHELLVKENLETFDGNFGYQFNTGNLKEFELKIEVEGVNVNNPIELTDLMLVERLDFSSWSQKQYGELLLWEIASGDIDYGISDWISEGIDGFGWIFPNGSMSQEIELVTNLDYIISGRLLKPTTTSSIHMGLYTVVEEEGDVEELVHDLLTMDNETFNGNFSYSFRTDDRRSYKFKITTTGVTSDNHIEVSDVVFKKNSIDEAWSQSDNEVYTLTVKVDKEGIEVADPEGNYKTIITPNEFAGFYNDNKIFTLNRDITNTIGLSIREKGLTIQPVKFIQAEESLDIVYIGKEGDEVWQV